MPKNLQIVTLTHVRVSQSESKTLSFLCDQSPNSNNDFKESKKVQSVDIVCSLKHRLDTYALSNLYVQTDRLIVTLMAYHVLKLKTSFNIH